MTNKHNRPAIITGTANDGYQPRPEKQVPITNPDWGKFGHMPRAAATPGKPPKSR